MIPTVPIWGIDLGDRAITAARVQRAPDGVMEVLSWWTAPLRGDPVASAVEILRRRRLQDHGLVITLPARGAVCRSFRIAPEDADLPPTQLGRELEDLTTFDGPEAALRFRRLGGPGSLDFMVVAERLARLQPTMDALRAAGFPHLGVCLEPAATLQTLELLRPGAGRGYALRLNGRWSSLLALDGLQVVRYLIPFGMDDLEEEVRRRDPTVDFQAALGAAPGTAAAERTAALLEGSLEALITDLRRLVDFHRVVLKGTGDESLEFYGPGSDQPGLRSALGRATPVPLFQPRGTADLGSHLRPAPGVRVENLTRALPLLLPCLGAAAAALEVAPREFQFSHLPAELPVPRERTLHAAASVVLAAATAASLLLSTQVRDAWAAVPPPEPVVRHDGGPLVPLESATGAAFRTGAFSEALAAVAAAAPDSGDPTSTRSLMGFRVTRDGDGYLAEVRVLAPGLPETGASVEGLSALPALAPLLAEGWFPATFGGQGTVWMRRRIADLPPEAGR